MRVVVVLNTLSDGVTAIILIRYRRQFRAEKNEASPKRADCRRAMRYNLCIFLYLIFTIAAILYGFLMVTYSCNVLDAFANALALLFINDIDERVFDIMKLFGWVADLRNEDKVQVRGRGRILVKSSGKEEGVLQRDGTGRVRRARTSSSPSSRRWAGSSAASPRCSSSPSWRSSSSSGTVWSVTKPLRDSLEAIRIASMDGNTTAVEEAIAAQRADLTDAYTRLFAEGIGANKMCLDIQHDRSVGARFLLGPDADDVAGLMMTATTRAANFDCANAGDICEGSSGEITNATDVLGVAGEQASRFLENWNKLPILDELSLYTTLLVIDHHLPQHGGRQASRPSPPHPAAAAGGRRPLLCLPRLDDLCDHRHAVLVLARRRLQGRVGAHVRDGCG